MVKIKVYLVDDHPIVRQGICSLLSNYTEFDIVGEAANGTDALAHIGEINPDVTLLDIRLPDLSGINVLQQLTARQTNTRVIMLTSFEDVAYVQQTLALGAQGFVQKSALAEELVNAILTVHSGALSLSPKMAHLLDQKPAADNYVLSSEEIKILQLLAEGHQHLAIANQMYMSEATLKRKLKRIQTHIGAQNRLQAVAEAVRRGII